MEFKQIVNRVLILSMILFVSSWVQASCEATVGNSSHFKGLNRRGFSYIEIQNSKFHTEEGKVKAQAKYDLYMAKCKLFHKSGPVYREPYAVYETPPSRTFPNYESLYIKKRDDLGSLLARGKFYRLVRTKANEELLDAKTLANKNIEKFTQAERVVEDMELRVSIMEDSLRDANSHYKSYMNNPYWFKSGIDGRDISAVKKGLVSVDRQLQVYKAETAAYKTEFASAKQSYQDVETSVAKKEKKSKGFSLFSLFKKRGNSSDNDIVSVDSSGRRGTASHEANGVNPFLVNPNDSTLYENMDDPVERF